MNMTGIFITGSDTDVGKTYVGAALTAHLFKSGIKVTPRKPAESGCTIEDNELIPADATNYFQAIDETEPLETICTYRYKESLAPPAAALLEGKEIFIKDLAEASIKADSNDLHIIEGAGGIYSPIAFDGSNATLCKTLGVPALVIVENRLGCINQTLLTFRALIYESIPVLAIVLNEMNKTRTNDYQSNINFLKNELDCPVLEFNEKTKTETLIALQGLIRKL